jgi:hypothetical protein
VILLDTAADPPTAFGVGPSEAAALADARRHLTWALAYLIESGRTRRKALEGPRVCGQPVKTDNATENASDVELSFVAPQTCHVRPLHRRDFNAGVNFRCAIARGQVADAWKRRLEVFDICLHPVSPEARLPCAGLGATSTFSPRVVDSGK